MNVFHDFEMKGLVSVVTYNLADGKSLIEAHKKLKEQVRDVGATHIFKIEYFDYRNVARDMKVPASILKKIEK